MPAVVRHVGGRVVTIIVFVGAAASFAVVIHSTIWGDGLALEFLASGVVLAGAGLRRLFRTGAGSDEQEGS